ncbi:hypothetical protein CH333_03050 [candidate division WOR-3 bacterium JGI_Cruoil_03_44_89]|uniref:Uncharacterized protein n=1 Tax=candidate division WOR-3 bacterium JGI_Cruoil_03_44_89 TaxID=1973748 RepID=A0A235BW01_UNCW3|nr:MAG: hypothetical protein CH333_03050 [candidate division WOR-3 bacterium JGI_Cruoil_03_44_89]
MSKLSKIVVVVISLLVSFFAGTVFSTSVYTKCEVLSKKAEGFQIDMPKPLKRNELYLLKYKGKSVKTSIEGQKMIYKFELVKSKEE